MLKEEIKYRRHSFVSAVRFAVAKTMIDLPSDLHDKTILDIGGGASDFILNLRELGAHAISIDFRYKDLEELTAPYTGYLKDFLTQNPVHAEAVRLRQPSDGTSLLEKLGNFLKEKMLEKGWGGYAVQSERTHKRFLEDVRSNGGTSYVAAFAERLPFKDNIADFCYSIECLSAFTINNKSAFIKSVSEAIRVLKPGGELQIYP